MKRILLVGSQHGDETLGDDLLQYILNYHPELMDSVDMLIANPKAHSLKKRYLETDMNRSYIQNPKSYEERRASHVLSYIKKGAYDLVLDLHTTTCVQQPCLLIPKLHPITVQFVKATSIKHIVIIEHDIAKHSLIGNTVNTVSVEVNRDSISDELLEGLCQDMKRYCANKSLENIKLVYFVTDLLLKSELPPTETADLQNFIRSSHGFYPILVGENSYKKNTNYLGFKATRMERIKL